MKYKIFILVVFSLFSTTSIYSTNIDSLRQLLNTVSEREKPEILNQIFSGLEHSDIDSALFFAQEALSLSIKNEDDLQSAVSYHNIGQYYYIKDNFHKAINNFEKAIPIYEKLNLNKELIAVYNKMAEELSQLGEYEKSFEILFKALKISEENNYEQENMEINRKIGLVYRILGEYEKASEHLDKALAYEKNKSNPDNEKMSKLYQNIGLVYFGKKEYDKALEYLDKGLEHQKDNGNLRILMLLKNAKALVYSETGKHELAINLYKDALEDAKKLDSKDLMSAAQLNIGFQLMLMEKYQRAIKEINKGLEIAKRINHKKWLRNGYNYLYYCYVKLNDFENGLDNYQMFNKYKDSLKIEKTKQTIAELETKYDVEKKEKQIELLNKENEIKALKLKKNNIRLYSAIAFALLAITGSFIFFRLLRQRQKARELIERQKTELKLTENLRNYYQLANFLPLIVFITDNSGKVNFINDSGLNLLGLSREEFENGVNIFDMLQKKDKKEFENDINNALNNRQIGGKQLQFILKNKKRLPVLEFLSPNIINGKVMGILGVMIDLSDIKKMEKEILSSVINTENKERKRFSEDLHDGLGPLLSSIKLYISGLSSAKDEEKEEMLKYTKDLIDDSIKSVRTISNNILPSTISDDGLIVSLKSFCNKLEFTKAIKIDFTDNIKNKRYDQSTEVILYRVIQELINNTIKHASAKNISIVFSEEDDQLNIKYYDNGSGFDVEKTLNSQEDKGLGLKNIVNRIKSLNGTIEIKSDKSKGTEVLITV